MTKIQAATGYSLMGKQVKQHHGKVQYLLRQAGSIGGVRASRTAVMPSSMSLMSKLLQRS